MPHTPLILRSTCKNNDMSPTFVLPLSCDFILLPEVSESKKPIVHLIQQLLKPCGVDNVILMEGLIPQQGYLMSLNNCISNAERGARIPLEPVPSTFYFSTKSSGIISQEFGIMVDTQQQLTTLNVEFDMTNALLQMSKKNDVEIFEQRDDSKSNEEDRNTTCTLQSKNRSDVYQLLESKIYQDARDAEVMLFIVVCAFFVLLVVFGLTVYMTTSKRKKSQIVSKVFPSESTESLCGSYPISNISGNIFQHKSLFKEGAIAKPVTAQTSIPLTRLQGSKSVVKEPLQPVFIREGSWETSRKKSLDLNQNGGRDIPELIPDQDRIKHECYHNDDRDDDIASPKVAIKSDISITPVSPCSKLANDWEQSKAKRQSRRRNRPPLTPLIPMQEDLEKESSNESNTPISHKPKRLVPLSLQESQLCSMNTEGETFFNDYW